MSDPNRNKHDYLWVAYCWHYLKRPEVSRPGGIDKSTRIAVDNDYLRLLNRRDSPSLVPEPEWWGRRSVTNRCFKNDDLLVCVSQWLTEYYGRWFSGKNYNLTTSNWLLFHQQFQWIRFTSNLEVCLSVLSDLMLCGHARRILLRIITWTGKEIFSRIVISRWKILIQADRPETCWIVTKSEKQCS